MLRMVARDRPHTMMGRFGNVLLVNGQTSPSFDVTLGEVVRL